MKPDTLNLIEDKVRTSLDLIRTGDNVLICILRVQALRTIISNWDFLKLQSFFKHIVNRTKQQSTEWRKTFTNIISDRGLISKIYKERKNIYNKKPNNPVLWISSVSVMSPFSFLILLI